MIHGYDYRLVRAAEYSDRHGTWVKPAIIKEALKTHDFVISLDSDAVFTHLDLPLEWLMNLWDFTPESLVAMAYDLDWEGDYDPQGNLIFNTGFIIAQASQRTQQMFQRWEDCPRSIPGCEHWNFKWAHEQSAFSHYIRYEFNRTHDVKNIPCNHANGNEYSANGQCECQGVFVSHNWKNKDKTPELLSRSQMAAISELIDFVWKPPRQPGVVRRPLDRTLPENSKYFRNWGFTVYRTYYGPESDKHWNILLDLMRQQTLLALGYHEDESLWENDHKWEVGWYKSKAAYLSQLNQFKNLFRLDAREDASLLDGLDIASVRELCLKEHSEAEEKLTGAAEFCFVLVADEAVLRDIAREEFVIKAVGYDWVQKEGGWGWVRLHTHDLLELWEMLLLSQLLDINKYHDLGFDEPEGKLEKYIWPGDMSLPPLADCSQVQTANPSTPAERARFRFDE
ncbi:hypothetical protein NW762_011063 [Fusarium torreyae]|uniref:Nucleotide-diphospho-sugar transferase domain-containing protein n=1 Tax=Fusarium torreyae TaxID=1237075 RepID=A0A9W8RS25_9HYPO|nr:hypothetical protein NW762_011063 [Fusarium torreyae]